MSIINKIYPPEIRSQERLSPVLPLLRFISIPIFFISALFKLHPNFITILSFVTLILSAFFASQSDFLISSILMLLTLSLDCVDGELARYTDKKSILGLKMESAHADLTLLIYPSCVSIGLFNSGFISIWMVLLAVISSSVYVNWREILSTSSVDDNPNKFSKVQRIIFSQQKPNKNIRNSTFLGKLIFVLRMNTVTQASFPFLFIVIFLLLSPSRAVLPLQVLVASQGIIGISLFLGKLILKK